MHVCMWAGSAMLVRRKTRFSCINNANEKILDRRGKRKAIVIMLKATKAIFSSH